MRKRSKAQRETLAIATAVHVASRSSDKENVGILSSKSEGRITRAGELARQPQVSKQALEESRNQVSIRQERLETQKLTIDDLEKSAQMVQPLSEELESKKRKLDEVREVLADVSENYDKEAGRARQLEKRSRRAEASRSRLRESQTKLKKESSLTEGECVQLEAELTGTKDELQDTKDELQDVRRNAELQVQSFGICIAGLECELELSRQGNLAKQLEINRSETHTEDAQKVRKCLEKKFEKLKERERRLEHAMLCLRRTLKSMRQCLRRARVSVSKLQEYRELVQRTCRLMEKGVYTPAIRSLVRQLATFSCPLRNIGPTIDSFYQLMIKPLLDSNKRREIVTMDERTVSRIIGEGGVAADLQEALELLRAPVYTMGADGTSNRGQNFESMHVNLLAPDSYANPDILKPKIRRGEVHLSANHRASTQIAGDLRHFENIIQNWNRAPLGIRASGRLAQPFNMRFFFMKLAGTHGDHAEDQKAKHRQLGEIKKEQTELAIGEKVLYAMPVEERTDIFRKTEESIIQYVGGRAAWEALDVRVQQRHMEKMLENLLRELAMSARTEMSEDELRLLSHWIWAGCQMHKDHNAVKGGHDSMRAAWKSKAECPCMLANRDNAVALEMAASGGAGTAVLKHATNATTGGAVKLAELAGAVFNHKDDKKGQHDVFRDYAKAKLGLTFTFPDTSNTRFGSVLDAAAELLERKDFYLEYLDYMRDAKESRTLNHMEENVKTGILDLPTQTELAVFTLYQEAISQPYISRVRGPGLEECNALDMGALHGEVDEQISKLIDSPELLLSPSADPKLATLNGRECWKRPGAVHAVHELASDLPFLREMLIAFLRGAQETWKRFSAEFRPDGEIAKLTEAEKKLLWMPTTNDANEGALGEYRTFARRFPNGGLALFNALQRFRHNNTQDFMNHVLDEDDEKYLRKESRRCQDSKQDQETRKAVAETNIAEAQAKRQKRDEWAQKKKDRMERLDAIELILDMARVEQMKDYELKDQIAKHRKLGTICVKAKDLARKEDRLRELTVAIEEYMRRYQIAQ